MSENNVTGNSRESMMNRLQEIGLTLVDLTEYLDTHLSDSLALQRWREVLEEYTQLLNDFEQLFGPLSLSSQNGDMQQWLWATQDFPWDYEA